jgi:polyhydroxybutyrate depolymerase
VRTYLGLVLVCVSLLPVSGCLMLAGARAVESPASGATALHRLRVHGVERSFVLTLPESVSPRVPVPLVLAFHGFRGNAGLLQYASELDQEATRRGWAVAYPNGTGRLRLANLSWNAATCCGGAESDRVDDVGFVHALIDTLARAGVIDPRYVVATGFSAGGMLAIRLACEQQPVIAAVADVAGAMPDTNCTARHPMPMLLLRGDRDRELDADHDAHRSRNNHHFATSFAGAQQFWSRHNGCAGGLARDSTETMITVTSLGCPETAPVRQLILRGFAHEWPGGRTLNRLWPHDRSGVRASTLVLDFFAQSVPTLAAR